MSLADLLLPVLCAPFFTSCKAMEFAEIGHRREERPDLPVSLLMVVNALRLECEKLMELTAGGNLSTDSPVRRQKRFQSALWKFQHFTGWLWKGTLCLGGFMREDRCCDRGNFPRARLFGSRLSRPTVRKANQGLCRRSTGERRN